MTRRHPDSASLSPNHRAAAILAPLARLALAACLGLAAGCASTAQDPPQGDPGPPHGDPGPPQGEPEERHGPGHAILMWLPNRVFDVLDVVRARVRVGPGWTLSARATELIDVNLGAHTTVFAGLRGPRGAPRIPWPFGIENFAGVEVSVLDGTQERNEHAPRYGLAEFGVGFQVLIVGVDVGVDVFEVGDFLVGIVFFDPMDDDY